MLKINKLDLGSYEAYEAAPGVGAWRYKNKLPLTTSGHLRVMAIGVGAAFSQRMFQSNFIISKGNDTLWIDLGSKTPQKLHEFQLSVHDIKNLTISHLHADHVGGMEEWCLKRRYQAMYMIPRQEGEDQSAWSDRAESYFLSGKFRHNLYIPHDFARDLWDMTLRGGLAHSEEINLNGVSGLMQPADYYILVPLLHKSFEFGIDCYNFNVGSINIKAFRTKHVPDSTQDLERSFFSLGYLIDDRVYISGDTKFDPNPVLNFGSRCEVIFHDCQSFRGGVHAAYDEIKTLPVEIKNKMHLYHLDDNMLFKTKEVLNSDGFVDFMQPAPVVYDFLD